MIRLTENGVIRIVSNLRYSNAQPVEAIATSLRSLYSVDDHRAEHDTVSRLISGAQVTDTYLITQAAPIGAQLATFDRRITSVALPHAEHVIYQIP